MIRERQGTPPDNSSATPKKPSRIRRGAYLLPSLLTICNILLGFYAIIRGLRGDFANAALFVFVAGVIDGLDGRIARAIGTESDFGKEYDSLADVLTFGATPALLTYLWGLREFDHHDAWLIPLFFLVCCATRLARFNVQHKIVDARWFVGLPTPAAAGAVCSILFFLPNPSEHRLAYQSLVAFALLATGLLMVSTFRYRSFKSFDLKRRWSYRSFVPIAAILLVMIYLPRATFLAIGFLYSASGPLSWLGGKLGLGRRNRDLEAPPAS
mgnify:CR=1 FL=1